MWYVVWLLLLQLFIIRPHHHTTYKDAAYHYRWSSMVCWSDAGLLVQTVVQKRISQLRCHLGFGINGSFEPLLDRGPDPHAWRWNFEGKKGLAQVMSSSQYIQNNSAAVRNVCCWRLLGCTGWWGTHWQIRLNRPCAVVMRPYVKLLWPAVFFVQKWQTWGLGLVWWLGLRVVVDVHHSSVSSPVGRCVN